MEPRRNPKTNARKGCVLMAARIHARHQEDVRRKIQASQIINRLQAYFDGKIDLSAGQIQTAKILLDKSVSNAPTELTGAAGGPLTVEIVKFVEDKAA